MSFRFRRYFSLLPGVRLNVGATGASVSVGPKGAKLTLGPKGVRATAGVPGSGLFLTQQFGASKREHSKTEQPELELPPEIKQVIQDRPQHWEFLLIQRALRSTANEINSMAVIASTYGTDAFTFHQWIREVIAEDERIASEWCDVINSEMQKALGQPGKPGDSDLLVAAVDHLIDVTRRAIECAQRAAALARHPLYGSLADPFGIWPNRLSMRSTNCFNDLMKSCRASALPLSLTYV